MGSKHIVRFSKRLFCGVSLSALATIFTGHASAQQQPTTDAEQVETVTVIGTGTLIKGITTTGANVVNVDATTIQASGAITTDQVLEQVPQISNAFNQNAAAPTAANFSGFRPQLRNIPSEAIVGGAATLLLLVDPV